jgi:hypothetical protein
MPQPLAGPGLGLPFPQNLFPTDLFNAPLDCPTNEVLLSPGNAIVLPAGDWYVNRGKYSDVQFLDPVTNIWRFPTTPLANNQFIKSDGFTVRVANLLGTPVSGVILAGGTGYVQATTTITANVGGSTWQPIVGGSLGVQSIVAPGSGFGNAPLVFIPAPPSPGIAATAVAALTAGTVSSVTLTNFGAGYTAQTVSALLLPSTTDPNFATASAGTVTFTLTNAGALTGALVTGNGEPLATISALTLSVGGSGTGASVGPLVLQTVTGSSITAGGAGFGTATAFPLVTTSGGINVIPSSSTNPNPKVELTDFVPRPAQGSGTTNAGGTISAINFTDGGKFLAAPSPIVIPAGGEIATTAATVTLTTGSVTDVVVIQPAP